MALVPIPVVTELEEIIGVSVESHKIPYGGTGHQVGAVKVCIVSRRCVSKFATCIHRKMPRASCFLLPSTSTLNYQAHSLIGGCVI